MFGSPIVTGRAVTSAAALVAEHALTVTMSQIAAHVGIGRATLYKHFADVQAIVAAWHERQVTAHLDQLTAVAAGDSDPGERLHAGHATYLTLSSGSSEVHAGHASHAGGTAGTQVAMALHRAAHMPAAHQRLHELVTSVITGAADAGTVRADVPPTELAAFCLHGLAAAAVLPSPDSRARLLEVTWSALLPPR